MAGVVVAEARNSLEAVLWVDALKAEGIPATSFERSVAPAMGGVDAFARFPVMVPAEKLGAARSVIADLAGATRLSIYRDPADVRARQTGAFWLVGAIVVVVLVISVVAAILA